MTFKDKLLSYLGFCPSKESAQRFRIRNTIITFEQSFVGVGFILIFILLVNASNVYASAVTVDTILILFSLIVLSVILAIVVVGGLIARTKVSFVRDPWYWGRLTFTGIFIMVLVMGATEGVFFISPTDGWVEIIAEALAISLTVAVVEVITTQAYFRWRKDKE